jgi:hypothetical protein
MQYQSAPKGSELEHKLDLYAAAFFLFEHKKSHPQIVEFLSRYEENTALLINIVDKAMREDWDKLYEYSREQFSKGKTYDEVVNLLRLIEKDEQIIYFICNKWYEWKTEYLEMLNESPYNISEGLAWMAGCVGMLSIIFIADFSWFSKIMWSLALVISLLQFLTGLGQKRLAKQIDRLLNRSTR